MKGKYAGRPDGSTEGGERVLLWATVLKTRDMAHHVVSCAGEVFTPSALGMSAAEPTAEDLRQAAPVMAAWEKQEAERIRAEEAAAAAEAAEQARIAEDKRKLADLESSGIIERLRVALGLTTTSAP